jgi:hypothetical protein
MALSYKVMYALCRQGNATKRNVCEKTINAIALEPLGY